MIVTESHSMFRNLILASTIMVQVFGMQPSIRLLLQARRALSNPITKTVARHNFKYAHPIMHAPSPVQNSMHQPTYALVRNFSAPSYSKEVQRHIIRLPEDIQISVPARFELTNTIYGDENYKYGPDYKYQRFNVYALNFSYKRTWIESCFLETFSSQIRQQYGIISPSYSMQKFFNGNIIEEKIHPTHYGSYRWRIVEHEDRELSGRRDIAFILFVEGQQYCSAFVYAVSVHNFPSLEAAIEYLKDFVQNNIIQLN